MRKIIFLIVLGFNFFISFPSYASGTIYLKYEYQTFEFPAWKNNYWGEFEKYYYNDKEIILSLEELKFLDQKKIKIKKIKGVNRAFLENFLINKVQNQINQEVKTSEIIKNEKERYIFKNGFKTGLKLNTKLAVKMLEYAIKNKIKEINLPVKKIYPQIKIPKNLQKLGIKKIISTGWSDFSGSSENRIYNINHSRKKFDGIIIKPQEIFSFNKILGQVNGQTGYKKELVIKGPDTIPEYGGGVCQVSSTLFRAIMLSGAPITERLNHSYSVKYYNPVGSDATIYPGVQDLKFVNNSNSHLMIQTYLEENILYFYLLGEKKLSNTVETFGPFITNYKPIPKTRFVPSKTLKDQEKLLISKEVQGFNVTWYRLLDNNLVETIFSKYQSRPKVYKVGGLKEEKRGSL